MTTALGGFSESGAEFGSSAWFCRPGEPGTGLSGKKVWFESAVRLRLELINKLNKNADAAHKNKNRKNRNDLNWHFNIAASHKIEYYHNPEPDFHIVVRLFGIKQA